MISLKKQPASTWRKTLLYGLIGSIVVGACFGIFVVLRNEWHWFEVRVMLSILVIGVASLLGLGCDLSRTPSLGRGIAWQNLLPALGLATCLVTAAALLLGIWTDASGESFWKGVATGCIVTISTVHVSMLGIAQLARRFKWVMFVAYQTVYGLAALLVVMLWGSGPDDQLARLTIVLGIVNAAITLIIPLLHRISRGELRANEGGVTPVSSMLEQASLQAIDEEILQVRNRLADLEQIRSRLLAGSHDLDAPPHL